MTSPAPVDTALAPARDKLANAIHALIDPRRQTLDGGRHTWLDSVYAELAEAVYEKHARGGGSAQPASPLWIDASDCLTEIWRLAHRAHPEHPGYTSKDRYQSQRLESPTVLRLQIIAERKWRPQDTERITDLAAELERLTAKAVHLLESQLGGVKDWSLPNPCPNCGRTHVYVDSGGDRVRRPALQITESFCRCRNPDCDGFWRSIEFQFLGTLLGYRPPEGVISV